MQIIYEDRDITDRCIVTDAEYRDVSGGRLDSLDIRFSEPGKWEAWGPQENDRLRILSDGCDTGTLYVAASGTDENRFRILATAGKSPGKTIRRNTYMDKSLKQIVALCAGECGMDWRIYGLDENIRYRYLQRGKESAAAFLSRLGQMEGAVLKTYSGRLTLIGIEAAQKLPATQTLNITPGMEGVRYTRRISGKLGEITVLTPLSAVRAVDGGAQGCGSETVNLPAWDNVTAGRWARGMLLTRNRQAESLEIECKFRGSWTAMERIDVTGGTAADGEWMIDSVRHDFINKTSRAELRRVIRTVK